MFEIAGRYQELIVSLFPQLADGHLQFGSARSTAPVAGVDALVDWIEFRDYIMEGFVRYSLRAVPSSLGLRLDVRLAETNRDKYVAPSVRFYIQSAGFSLATQESESSR